VRIETEETKRSPYVFREIVRAFEAAGVEFTEGGGVRRKN
jgi:hypothetical protein